MLHKLFQITILQTTIGVNKGCLAICQDSSCLGGGGGGGRLEAFSLRRFGKN